LPRFLALVLCPRLRRHEARTVLGDGTALQGHLPSLSHGSGSRVAGRHCLVRLVALEKPQRRGLTNSFSKKPRSPRSSGGPRSSVLHEAWFSTKLGSPRSWGAP